MRRHIALLTLLVCEALVAALSVGFQLRSRVAVLEAFRAFDTAIPPLTRLALSPWLLPLANGVAIAVTLGALLAPLRRSRRGAVVALGLVVSSTALVFAVIASFMPIFNPG